MNRIDVMLATLVIAAALGFTLHALGRHEATGSESQAPELAAFEEPPPAF